MIRPNGLPPETPGAVSRNGNNAFLAVDGMQVRRNETGLFVAIFFFHRTHGFCSPSVIFRLFKA